ncbi:MAG: RNA methyltransferase [Pseudomonadota bacterium]
MAGDRWAGRALDVAATLKEATALQTDRGFRDRRGLFFVEGVRNFIHAVDSGFAIERILYSERLLTSPVARKLVRQSRRSGVCALNLSPEQYRRMSRAERASGIAAVLRQRWSRIEQASIGEGLCWIAIETVRSPGNLGTLIRSSRAAGGARFILIGPSIDPFSPDVVRSAMGALDWQAFIRSDWDELRLWTKEQTCDVVGASLDGDTDLHRLTCPKAPLLVLGEERHGLTEEQRELCSHLVRIPMTKGTDSLNLGVAGTLLMYEVYRSRGSPPPTHLRDTAPAGDRRPRH